MCYILNNTETVPCTVTLCMIKLAYILVMTPVKFLNKEV